MTNFSISRKTWIVISSLAIASAIFYFLLQLIDSADYKRPLSKQVAMDQATQFAEEYTGLTVKQAEAYHDADKEYTGYLDKYKLVEEHKEKFEKYLPYDQYRVNVNFSNNIVGSVYMNLYNGNVIGWQFNLDGNLSEQTDAYKALEAAVAKLGFPVNENTHIDTYERVLEQEQGLAVLGDNQTTKIGYYVSNDDLSIKDAFFQYDSTVIEYNGSTIVSKLVPTFMIPEDYTDLVKRQDLYAQIWTLGVYTLFSFVLGILAIIYAILYRRHTSFKYGSWLTVIATIIYTIVTIGFFKSQFGLEGGFISTADPFMLIFFIVISVVSVIAMAVSYYFSFIAGDGLWKAQGFRLWPRFRDRDYGQHVWNSMKIGYLMALIGLGLQTIIFLVLSLVQGTWTANDTSQSLLNFEFMWLFPALAWFAAISEEVVFRYFGTGIFRRWFKNTWVAALIPTIVWAAGHTLYPFYPATTRVIELIFIGLFFTWIMMRFGFIAAIFTHAIFDTILMSMSLMLYGESIDIVLACFYLVLPLLIALVIKWLHSASQRKKDTEKFNAPQYPHSTP